MSGKGRGNGGDSKTVSGAMAVDKSNCFVWGRGGSRELGRVMGTQWKWCLFSIPRRIKSPESEFSSMSYKVQTLK